jgi:hypothetical protein
MRTVQPTPSRMHPFRSPTRCITESSFADSTEFHKSWPKVGAVAGQLCCGTAVHISHLDAARYVPLRAAKIRAIAWRLACFSEFLRPNTMAKRVFITGGTGKLKQFLSPDDPDACFGRHERAVRVQGIGCSRPSRCSSRTQPEQARSSRAPRFRS